MDFEKLAKRFLCVGSDQPDYFRYPGSKGEYSYACNRNILLRVPRVEGCDREFNPPLDLNYLAIIPEHEGSWMAIPAYDHKKPELVDCWACKGIGHVVVCRECSGNGLVGWHSGFNDYDAECKSCQGEGIAAAVSSYPTAVKCDFCEDGKQSTQEWPTMMIGPDEVGLYLLDKIRDLPGVEIYTPALNNMMSFRFHGGDGILMTVD